MPYQSRAQRAYMHIHHPEIAKRWDKEFPNQEGLPLHTHAKRIKAKIKVNNKLKGALGLTTFNDKNKAEKIEINIKRHKGDKAELASTIKHELMHAKYPKMTEREVYKRTAKTKIPLTEQQKLLAILKVKEDFKPGELISKMNEKKKSINSDSDNLSKREIAIRGLV